MHLFGPRYTKLADMVSGNDEQSDDVISSSSSNQELDGGTEIWWFWIKFVDSVLIESMTVHVNRIDYSCMYSHSIHQVSLSWY